ncbi:UDP-N-acetylmuramoylalanyl-D-glutamyl-2, 6-diaminopimelate--D-alanyl-D-alanine ligase, partial [Gordonia sp. GONU]|uniref:glutamate ligase domain-containing protein n=1 Tax=Gordonia sp. GONU TaxID=2972949 RepID=UPI00281521E8
HLFPTAPAAAAAGGGLGVAIEDIATGLSAAGLSGLRMELAKTSDGATVLNDAYNANPTSMSAALKSLAALPAGRRVAVLGTMAELGADSPGQHLAIALEARELGIEVIAVDEPNYGDTARHTSGVDEAVAALGELAGGDAVLVKGSRVAALERVAQALLR